MKEKIKTPIGVFDLPQERSGEMYAENNEWEKNIRDEFAIYASPYTNSIDIGAHIGYHTVALSKLCSFGIVYSFEPNTKLIPLLVKNVWQNECKNVVISTSAVSNENGKAYFGENENLFLNGIVSQKTETSVETITLDSIMDKMPKIGLIKIDTEGHEIQVLEGAKNLIKRDMPVIFIEIWRHNYIPYIKYLSSIGYMVYMIDEENFVAKPKVNNLNTWIELDNILPPPPPPNPIECNNNTAIK